MGRQGELGPLSLRRRKLRRDLIAVSCHLEVLRKQGAKL